jgi:Flp pilus assembly pilin Flp
MKFKQFLMEEDGMGTAEVVIIAAVLVAIALMFKETIIQFVDDLLTKNFGIETKIVNE